MGVVYLEFVCSVLHVLVCKVYGVRIVSMYIECCV